MKKKPLVSVIMNCHNGEKYLKDSVNSILKQSYKNWELIFWDNLSTDNSKKIIKNFKDKRIRYFKSKKFFNLYEARNHALKKARGKFISFLDTDDWWLRNKIKKQIQLYYKKKNTKLIYCNCYLYNQKSKKIKLFVKNKLPEGNVTQELLNNYSVGLLTILVKKDVFANQSFSNKLNIIGDFDFVIRLSKKEKFACVQEPLAYYRQHGKNYSEKNSKLYMSEIKNWLKANKADLTKKGFSLKTQEILLKKLQIKNYLKKITNIIPFMGRVVQW